MFTVNCTAGLAFSFITVYMVKQTGLTCACPQKWQVYKHSIKMHFYKTAAHFLRRMQSILNMTNYSIIKVFQACFHIKNRKHALSSK